MKAAAVLAMLALAGASGLRTEQEYKFLFEQWTKTHGKAYKTLEESVNRYSIFKQNVDKIEWHNTGNHGYTMAINEFADLTQEEFAARYIGGFRPTYARGPMNLDLLMATDLPASVDWVTKGAVTGVKNQGQCGSCWSFSTTGSVEGITEIKTGKLVSLSEQQLMDCSGSYGNMGCNGGLMDDAFKYIIAEGGLCSEEAYPYQAAQGQCKASSCQKVATISGYQDVPQENVQAFKAAVAQQPVSIAIEADQFSFQFYSGGVMSGQCGTQLDHGVLAVGYGEDSGKGYWLVKNSWGASWGEQGYIRLAADINASSSSYNNGAGQCGILLSASYPTKN